MTPRSIVVAAWDVGHNAVIRAYYLADMLSRRYRVTLVGPGFSRFGEGLWAPIRDQRSVTMRTFDGRELPHFVDDARRACRDLEPDLVLAYRPKLPSLLIAHLIQRRRGVPVIVDIDEHEPSFFGARDGITLAELAGRRERPDFAQPFGESWTLASERLATDADAITTDNVVLRERYGGTLLHQTRDERAFDPGRLDRDALRAGLGLAPDDRVVVFAGTPNRHKGLPEIFDALEELRDPRYRLCVFGTITDPDLHDRLHASPRVIQAPLRPVADVPALTVIGDLVCLPLDSRSAIARHQTPGKLTEALALGVPVLARETPPLDPFLARELIHPLGDAPLAARIEELLTPGNAAVGRAVERGRAYFAAHLSYAAGLDTFAALVDRLPSQRRPGPDRWRDACRLASSVRPSVRAARMSPGGHSTAARARRRAPATRPRRTTAGGESWDIVLVAPDAGMARRRCELIATQLTRADWTRRVLTIVSPPHPLGPADPALAGQDGWLGHVRTTVRRAGIGRRPLLLWVCPPPAQLAALRRTIAPTLTLADVGHGALDERCGSGPQARWEPLAAISRAGDLVLTDSDALARRLGALEVTAHVLPDGVTPSAVRPAGTLRSPHTEPLIGYVGDLAGALDASLLAELARRRRDWRLLLAGPGRPDPAIEALGAEPNVIVSTVTGEQELARVAGSLDVGLLPLRSPDPAPGWTPPSTLLYAAAGVPVAGTIAPGLAELRGGALVGRTATGLAAAVQDQLQLRAGGAHAPVAATLLARHSWAARARQAHRLIDAAAQRRRAAVPGI